MWEGALHSVGAVPAFLHRKGSSLFQDNLSQIGDPSEFDILNIISEQQEVVKTKLENRSSVF